MDTQIRKLIRDNKVGVIISPSGQWYTKHNKEELLYLPALIELLESLEYLSIKKKLRHLQDQSSQLNHFLTRPKKKTEEQIKINTEKLHQVNEEYIQLKTVFYNLIKECVLPTNLLRSRKESVQWLDYGNTSSLAIPSDLTVEWISLGKYFRVNYDYDTCSGESIEFFNKDWWILAE